MRAWYLTPIALFLSLSSSDIVAAELELRLGAEMQDMRVRNVLPVDTLGGFFPTTTGPVLDPGLDGTALRVQASVGRAAGRDRLEVAVTRLDSEDSASATAPTLGVPLATVSYGVGAKWTTVDALWSRRIAGGSASTVRSQLGYRYASAERRADFAATYPNLPGCCQYTQSQVFTDTGHGVRVGLEASIRIAGPLRLEGGGGLALLHATRGGAETLIYREFQNSRQQVDFDGSHVLATFDVGARLAGTWGPVTATAGYRFDSRHEDLPESSVESRVYARLPLPKAEPVSFGGFTAGLTVRFGL